MTTKILPIILMMYLSIWLTNALPSFEYSDTGKYVTIPDETSPCVRPCVCGAPPMKCHYKFVVEWYQTLSRACYDCPKNSTDCLRPHCVPADGTNRAVLVVNRKMPGPDIQACVGDQIIVDVENHMQSEDTTIHWHGHHQRSTPYMDGVPLLTQCPIQSGSTFRYKFWAEHVGTHMWHSHSGSQRGDGIFGAMVIRQPPEFDPQSQWYDHDLPEHVIVVTDWVPAPAQSLFTNSFHSDGRIAINSLLVNGLGYFITSEKKAGVPPARFTVRKDNRYRFRVINVEFLVCPIEISVDNHTITVISTDGFDVEPVPVGSFVSYSGERFDFIINANQEIGNYWIRFRGSLACRSNRAHQVAVLSYEGADLNGFPATEPEYEFSPGNNGIQLNSVNENMSKNTSMSIPELNSVEPDNIALKENPDYKFFIHFDFYNVSNKNFYVPGLYDVDNDHVKFRMRSPQLNHISMNLQSFPLLSQRDLITSDMLCNSTTVKNCVKEFCQCTHVLQVPLNSVVELIFVDSGTNVNANHPFHLHGHAFRVIGMERFDSHTSLEEIKELDNAGLLKRKLHKAPIKDTVTVPSFGYTIVRFYADNPGYWLLHCHIDFHATLGMSLVFKVGEHKDMPPVPQHFPKCGNWMPK